MKHWQISYSENICTPELTKEDVKKDRPTLSFLLNEVPFQVVFENQSDYMAASYHTAVKVLIISNKGNRKAGVAVNIKKI